MSLDNLVIYSLAIFAGSFGLIIGVSYLAYKAKRPQLRKF